MPPVEQWDEAAVDRSVAVNLKGAFFLVHELPGTFAKPASIVLNTSIHARIGISNSSVCPATKAGLISMARTLSRERVGRGIRVNAVSPGPIATPLSDKIGIGQAEIDALVA
jgi:NAD(P)-dependent dehydrogenase (short-subunit alcohol dehydrogenase family)